MECKIIQLSGFADSILKSARTGTVHSVYRKTINLNIEGQLLALQARFSPLSPISLITGLTEDSMKELALVPGLPVTLSESSITIKSHTFYYDSQGIISLALPSSLSTTDRQQLKTNIENAVKGSATGGFDTIFRAFFDGDSQLPTLILEGAGRYMDTAFQAVLQKDFHTASRTLAKLTGLGLGLTPSGDDFLCGILAGLALSGMPEADFTLLLRREITAHLADTNDISRAFLLCALKNQYSLAVKSLLNVPSPGEIASSFGEIGHSSGFDTLCGIFFALCVPYAENSENFQ